MNRNQASTGPHGLKQGDEIAGIDSQTLVVVGCEHLEARDPRGDQIGNLLEDLGGRVSDNAVESEVHECLLVGLVLSCLDGIPE